MKELLKKYENIILLLALFLLASALLVSATDKDSEPNFLERAVLTVFTPIQKGVTLTMRNIADAWNHYVYLINTSRQNEELFKIVDQMRMKNMLLVEELKKYRRVDQLLSLQSLNKGRFQMANVVAWDSTNQAQTLVIDRGTQEGVKEGMVVLTHRGLIGRVVNLTRHASRVLMITDARSAIDAYIQEGRARLIVVGQNKRTSIVKYLSLDSRVTVGDVVISSGLGGLYPKGLPIGKISWLERGTDRLFYKAELELSAELNRIEEVLVMIDNTWKKEPLPE